MTEVEFEVNGTSGTLQISNVSSSGPAYRIIHGDNLFVVWDSFDSPIAQLEAQRAAIEGAIQIHRAAKRVAEEAKHGLV